MKIRVTLILQLCTSFAVNSENIFEDKSSSLTKFQDQKESSRFFQPKHRVYEYSRSIEAPSVDFRNEDVPSQRHRTKPLHRSYPANMEDLPKNSISSLSRPSMPLQMLGTLRNSKQSSKTPEVDLSRRYEKVLSRAKKDKMSQAVLPLLMAYKLKFAALIPILLGGMSLLVSTTALAGFFFALFAAVLGLKSH